MHKDLNCTVNFNIGNLDNFLTVLLVFVEDPVVRE